MDEIQNQQNQEEEKKEEVKNNQQEINKPIPLQARVKSPPVTEPIFHIEVDRIKPNPHQPRKDFNEESLRELANSIREFGILQPLVVSKIEKETEFGATVEYQLIAGERRLRAAKIAGLERVPVIIKNIFQDAERLEMAIVENLQRANLNPIETARAYAKLQDIFGLTQREIALKLSKSREVVANSLRLLNLPSEIQDAVSSGQINESQGRMLLMLDDINQQKIIFNDLLSNHLSVRELRSRIRPLKQKEKIKETKDFISEADPETRALEEKLSGILNTPVKIERTSSGGKIVISFYSPEEVRGIIEKLNPERQE